MAADWTGRITGWEGSDGSLGALMARALTGSWRVVPPCIDLSDEELDRATPNLVAWGAAGLVWWKLHQGKAETVSGGVLFEKYRHQVLQDAIREHEIAQLLPFLHAAGVEPIVIKGWAVAQHYAEPALRPSGDIDLCVHSQHLGTSKAVVAGVRDRKGTVDLSHEELDELSDGEWDDVFGRSRVLQLGNGYARVLGPEDELSLLCRHFLRHGAWRPLWLCDIAAAVEDRPVDFDWHRCFGEDRRVAGWIAHALALASQLLGAELNYTPLKDWSGTMPRWLVPAVLRQWERSPSSHCAPLPIRHAFKHPLRLPDALRRRWPDPIGASVRVHGPFTNGRRFLYQASGFGGQSVTFLGRLITDGIARSDGRHSALDVNAFDPRHRLSRYWRRGQNHHE